MSSGPQRKDAAATRAAILESATRLFTEHGYDGIGVREIAGGAGVTAMLVNRYFGSKEALFTEVVDTAFAPRTIVPGRATDRVDREMARSVARRTSHDADSLDPFLLTIRSAANPRAVEIMRDAIVRYARTDLTAQLGGRSAELRAELAMALVSGVWLMRSVIGLPALTGAGDATVARRVEAMLAAVLDEH